MFQANLLRLSAIGLAATAAVLPGQVPQTFRAPAPLLSALELVDGTVQDLYLPASADTFEITVMLGDRAHTLRLEAYEMRGPNFRLLVDDGESIRQVPTPPSITYRGTVDGRPDGIVSGTLVDGQVRLLVDLSDATWGIEPANRVMAALPATTHIVYRSTDDAAPAGTCGTDTSMLSIVDRSSSPSPGLDAIEQAEIALDCDFELYQRNGSSVTNTNNDAMSVMTGVDTIYLRDVEIKYLITTIIVRTAPVTRYQNASSSGGLLSAFRTEWNLNHTGVQRDVAHLLSGKGTFGSVLGIASLAVICNRSSAYGVAWSSGSLGRRRGLTAHELGHNWNAGHCDGSSPCWIMCSGLGGCNGSITKFGTSAINQIVNYKNSRNCLTPFAQNPATLATISQSTVNSYNALPPQITLTGTELDSVTSVNVGSTAASIVSNSFSSLTFTLPNGSQIGTAPVTVTNSSGPSNALSLTVLPVHPSVLLAPGIHTQGSAADYTVYTDAGWIAVIFVSANNLPSAVPNLVSFEIGNNFTSFFQLIALQADNGGKANLNFNVPAGTLPPFSALYYEAITYNGVLTAPIETSNAVGVIYF